MQIIVILLQISKTVLKNLEINKKDVKKDFDTVIRWFIYAIISILFVFKKIF